MSENLLSKIIAEQTEILLKNINSVVQSADLEAEFDGLNASRFIFHTLHSLDKWFVNPAEYKYDENSSGGVAENLSVISSYRQGFDAAPGGWSLMIMSFIGFLREAMYSFQASRFSVNAGSSIPTSTFSPSTIKAASQRASFVS